MEPRRPAPRKQGKLDPDSLSAGFCHVEKRGGERSRHFVVHSRSPQFTLEVGYEATDSDSRATSVIRSVRLPNSWSGDYHRCSALLGPALAFGERAREVDLRAER